MWLHLFPTNFGMWVGCAPWPAHPAPCRNDERSLRLPGKCGRLRRWRMMAILRGIVCFCIPLMPVSHALRLQARLPLTARPVASASPESVHSMTRTAGRVIPRRDTRASGYRAAACQIGMACAQFRASVAAGVFIPSGSGSGDDQVRFERLCERRSGISSRFVPCWRSLIPFRSCHMGVRLQHTNFWTAAAGR